ncbi:DoxX family protein [Flavobacterium sp. NRK1]|uniref:DoxX family protein n=1 Tax=Flavobacterium sp. NRK1 TaxID=2954929 RepID=UPI002093936E|nr:DoxX family protein [Flavobacterium sp. NRK1]MCO6148197.1 DoxX family protein [Flavobacterium sp. NRK1]
MKNLISTTSLNTDLATLLLRIIFGGMFIYHGWPKLTGYSQMVEMFGDPIGIGNELSVILVIFAEFFCGIFILLGFMTRFAVIPIFITMLVAFFVAHAKDDFMIKMLPFVYLFLCPVLFILGSGKYSADALLFTKRSVN